MEVNCEMLGLVCQDTRKKSKTINRLTVDTLVSPQRKAFLSPSGVNPYPGAIGFHVLDEVFSLWRHECFATCPHPYLFIQFSQKYFSQNQILPLIREIYSPQNISALR